jgi:hypothetical protein
LSTIRIDFTVRLGALDALLDCAAPAAGGAPGFSAGGAAPPALDDDAAGADAAPVTSTR